MKMAESSPNRKKKLREKEKLPVMSNFSFSHTDFKRLVLQTRKNQGLFGKGFNIIHVFYTSLYKITSKALICFEGKGKYANKVMYNKKN